ARGPLPACLPGCWGFCAMPFRSFLSRWLRRARGCVLTLVRRPRTRPVCESLEDRCVPAAGLPAGVGVLQPDAAAWYLRGSASPGAPNVSPFAFGGPGWVALAGDFDGNGTTPPAVYDPTTATWYVKKTATPGAPDVAPFRFGAPGWLPVVGDWT